MKPYIHYFYFEEANKSVLKLTFLHQILTCFFSKCPMLFQELSEASLGTFNKQKFSAFYLILVLQRLKSFIYRFSHSPFGRLARTGLFAA
jgi:hypothetical protein